MGVAPLVGRDDLLRTLLESMRTGLFTQMVIVPLFRDHGILTQVSGDHMEVIRPTPPLMIGGGGPRLLAAPGYTINATTRQIQTVTGANAGLLQYENERLQVDVNLEYQLQSWATLFLNGANVNDSRSIRYADHRANLIRDGGYGAKYTLGIKGTF